MFIVKLVDYLYFSLSVPHTFNCKGDFFINISLENLKIVILVLLHEP